MFQLQNTVRLIHDNACIIYCKTGFIRTKSTAWTLFFFFYVTAEKTEATLSLQSCCVRGFRFQRWRVSVISTTRNLPVKTKRRTFCSVGLYLVKQPPLLIKICVTHFKDEIMFSHVNSLSFTWSRSGGTYGTRWPNETAEYLELN